MIECSGEDVVLSIPDNINGVPVTIISEYTFERNSVLRDIKFPTVLKKFNLYSDCGINEIHIPKGVTTIEGNNFSYISNSDQWDMVHIYLPDSLEAVAADSFQNSPGVIIHAHAGSYAQRFAEENQITFEAVEE